MKVELGCPERKEGWTTIDVRGNPDIIYDLSEGIPLEDNSCSEVRAFHLIEHIHWKKTYKFLSEVYRILKPDGKFLVSFPDLKRIFLDYLHENTINLPKKSRARGPEYWKWLMHSLYAYDNEMLHKAAFDKEIIEWFSKSIGFKSCTQIKPIQSRAAHDRDICLELIK